MSAEQNRRAESSQPLILTLEMDAAASERFEALRQQHFPPERNIVPAHVTFFHNLPGEERESIERKLMQMALRQTAFPVRVDGLKFLGRGVAYTLDSPELTALQRQLAQEWAEWLIPQDRQKFHPHVVVQNKTTPEHARATLAVLQADFEPFSIMATGLLLWRYLGGPWELISHTSFQP